MYARILGLVEISRNLVNYFAKFQKFRKLSSQPNIRRKIFIFSSVCVCLYTHVLFASYKDQICNIVESLEYHFQRAVFVITTWIVWFYDVKLASDQRFIQCPYEYCLPNSYLRGILAFCINIHYLQGIPRTFSWKFLYPHRDEVKTYSSYIGYSHWVCTRITL